MGLGIVFLFHNRSLLVYSAVLTVLFAIGVYTADRVERATGEKDSRRIVIDEIAGMLVVGFALPPGVGYWIGGFVLFRALDILKPFPARWVERTIPGGWGIMLDDAVAGVYANLILQGFRMVVNPS